jgi:hypothetical protein
MSSDDGMDSSTQVSVVRCAWLPTALFYHARHSRPLSPKDPAPIALLGTENPWVWLPGARIHSELSYMEDLQWVDRW